MIEDPVRLVRVDCPGKMIELIWKCGYVNVASKAVSTAVIDQAYLYCDIYCWILSSDIKMLSDPRVDYIYLHYVKLFH